MYTGIDSALLLNNTKVSREFKLGVVIGVSHGENNHHC